MTDGGRSTWGWKVSAVVLAGGLLALGTGNGVTQAGDRDRDNDHNQRNPFQQILGKLDQILAAITVGGGGQEGNHTLRWDTNNSPASRFITAFPGAVLDKNTGLIWEQAPDTTRRTLSGSLSYCLTKNVGGTVGWRLPAVVELKSVQDPALPAPFVPASVFIGVQSAPNPLLGAYWSASARQDVEVPGRWWIVNFNDGNVSFQTNSSGGDLYHVWCVRGPMQESVY